MRARYRRSLDQSGDGGLAEEDGGAVERYHKDLSHAMPTLSDFLGIACLAIYHAGVHYFARSASMPEVGSNTFTAP